MRRLRRAHQKHAREQAKHRKKFRQRAIAAGTAAAITLGAGAGLNKALAAYTPDAHELPVSQDADADLLANTEEVAIAYHAFKGDQNRNQIPDGAELAKRCAADINELPIYDPYSGDPEPNETYKINHLFLGIESCDICGAIFNMGGVSIINPELGLKYPPVDPPYDFLPYIAVHYMEHGSFSFAGDTNSGRADVAQLLTVLELEYQYLYEPNEHHLPVDGNDMDGDLLTDSEEATAGYDVNEPDQDNDLVPDGIELARQCAEVIDGLPVYSPNPPGVNEPYKIDHLQKGLEYCDICGTTVNTGYWRLVNPSLGTWIDCRLIALHYMQHGSFNHAGSVHNGRMDVPTLVQVLEIPRRCGDLGTEFLAGDLNDDCEVSLADLGKLTERWLKDCSYFGTPYILGDLSGDCKVNLTDFANLTNQWLNSTEPGQD